MAFSSVNFLVLILLPDAIKMGTDDYCRPGDSTTMSLPFYALHKGTLIIFSIPFCYLVLAYATIFFFLSSLLSIFNRQQRLNILTCSTIEMQNCVDNITRREHVPRLENTRMT